jgi:16S rRNA A1518/A1519 N6-dimethyltransferase RsmA/KsgA/DIM1 with predicted DNA glycosylase/AP lyase activity
MRMKAFEISKIAFQQKRKKIKTALKDYIDEESSKKLSLDLNLRPQELTPENYLAIAEINS